MRKTLYKFLLWIAEEGQKQQQQPSLGTPPVNSSEEMEQSFKNISNERMINLEQKFEALCQHLKVNVHKLYGWKVEEYKNMGGVLTSSVQGNAKQASERR